MNATPRSAEFPATQELPSELLLLQERIHSLPRPLREDLEPILSDALEDALFRGRVLTVARDALERLRLDLELARFDLDATRSERESLRRRLDDAPL